MAIRHGDHQAGQRCDRPPRRSPKSTDATVLDAH